MDHDIPTLERQITDLQDVLRKLAAKKFDAQLIPIIKRPGWTTPAEFRLVGGMLTSMQAQAVQLATLQDTVLTASREIGKQRVPAAV